MTTLQKEVELNLSLPPSKGLTDALKIANNERLRFKRFSYGTAYLLLGLSNIDGAKEVLGDLGITTARILSNQTNPIFQEGKKDNQSSHTGLGDRARKALELAAGESKLANATEITPIYALIGIILESLDAQARKQAKGGAVTIMEELSGKNAKDLLAELRKNTKGLDLRPAA